MRVAGFVYSPLLPPGAPVGGSVPALVHVTDWAPTLLSAIGHTPHRPHPPFDGVDLWACLGGDAARCRRDEVLLNFNTVCDSGAVPGSYATECPAPKAAVRVGDLKLLAECYSAGRLTGKLELYNVTSDPSERTNLADALPHDVAALSARLLAYGEQAAQIPPLSDRAPWQGEGYYCARCTTGRPRAMNGTRSWDPWCEGGAGVTC